MFQSEIIAEIETPTQFEAIFYASATPMVLFRGPEMIFEVFNQKYHELYPNRLMLGKSIFEVVPELRHSPFPEILKKVYESGESYVSHEGLARIVNSETNQMEDRYFDTIFSRIDYGGREQYRILATPREVTDRVLLQKRREEILLELEEEKELRERFVSAVSHDLRTPLSVASINSKILKKKANDSEMVIILAEKISANMERADRMIRDLLDSNALKSGRNIPLNIEECQLSKVVTFATDNFVELYGERFEIKNNVGDLKGFWDCEVLHRIIENLVSNAIKYGSASAPIEITLSKGEGWVEIAVHNAGKAISKEDQLHLFDYYRRTDFAAKSGQKGWGIGLSLVKGLTEAHGGSVRVFSETASGTTFFIRLPLDARSLLS